MGNADKYYAEISLLGQYKSKAPKRILKSYSLGQAWIRHAPYIIICQRAYKGCSQLLLSAFSDYIKNHREGYETTEYQKEEWNYEVHNFIRQLSKRQ